MISYIVVISLIIMIIFSLIFFFSKRSKNKRYQIIPQPNNAPTIDNRMIPIEVKPRYDLEPFYKDFNLDDYEVLGLSNTDSIINSIINKGYQDTAVKSVVEKSVVEIVRTIIQTKTLQSVFRATADPKKLMQLSSGGLGAAVIENGKIVGQAGFVKISPAEMTAIIGPQAVFSVLSIVVGQHFMSEISQKLSDISEKLDKILLHFKKEDIAVLESSKKLIYDISKLNYTGIEHIGRLMNIEEDLSKIYQYYKKELESININNLNADKWGYRGKMKQMDKKLEEEINNAEFYVKICFYSKELLNLTQLVKFNTYIKMQNIDINAINKANELFEKINEWQEDLFCYEDIKPYNEYIDLIEKGKQKLKEIHQNAPIVNFIEDRLIDIDALFGSDFYKGNKLYHEKCQKLEERKKNIGLNNYKSISYKQSMAMIENMNKPKDIITLKDNKGNLISLCKKR